MKFVFLGRAAHSGMAAGGRGETPSRRRRGRSPNAAGPDRPETTANVGLIEGGVAGNIVPPECRVWRRPAAATRSGARALAQEMLDAAVHAANMYECALESSIMSEYEAYRFTRSHPPSGRRHRRSRRGYGVTYIESAAAPTRTSSTGRRALCEPLQRRGRDPHPSEHITVDDLEGMTRVTLALVAAALET